MPDKSKNDIQQKLSRLIRENSLGIQNEQNLVKATGTLPPSWTVRIKSLNSYNRYEVEQVQIKSPGINPSLVSGSSTLAYNLAESFIASGNLNAGTYAVMWRAGNKNVFYVKP